MSPAEEMMERRKTLTAQMKFRDISIYESHHPKFTVKQAPVIRKTLVSRNFFLSETGSASKTPANTTSIGFTQALEIATKDDSAKKIKEVINEPEKNNKVSILTAIQGLQENLETKIKEL